MDALNKRHSNGTYLLMRAEHLAVVVVCSLLTILHFHQLNLWRFVIAFFVIDIAGYLPGLFVYLRSGKGRISPYFHYAYNLLHSYLAWGVVILVWWQYSGWEWAMLAVPIHLSGDRGIFGNVFKPTDRTFEPSLNEL